MTSEEQTKRKGFTGSEAWKSSETKAKGRGQRIERVVEERKFQRGR
jgi:hypothetical protein